jgi:hypothetical protein
MIRKLASLLALVCLTSGAFAHWAPQQDLPDWAQRGKLRWALHYSRADKKLVDLFLDANQTMLHGSTFDSPETAEYARQRGLRLMPYVCSRTVTLSEIEKTPQLKGAMVLKLDGSEVLAYNNPVRRYGSLFQPAWPEFVRERTRRQWGQPGVGAIFYDNAFWEVDDHNPATIAAWQKWATAHGLAPGTDMPSVSNDPLSAAAKLFTAESLTDYHRMLKQFCNAHEPRLLNSPNLATATDGMEAVEAGAVDLVFYETMSHPPFDNNFYLYKVGLAASHGKPTAMLAYLPPSVGSERGEKTWNEGMHAYFYPSSPMAEEIALAVAEACAVDGTYIPCYNLFPSLPITDLSDPFNQRIYRELKRSYTFQKANENLYAGSQPAGEIAILYSSLTRLQQPRAQNGEGLSKALLGAGIPHEVMAASDLKDSMSKTRTLIVPNVTFMDDATAAGLRSFIEKGGRAIITGECGAADPIGQPSRNDAINAINGALRLFSRPVQSWTLNGMQPEGAGQICVSKEVGSASLTFDPPARKVNDPAAGRYVAYISMTDESDGTSSFSFSVAGKTVHEGKLDYEDERSHLFKTAPFTAKRGDKLQLTVTANAGERGRVQSILLVSADAEQGAALGKGRIVYSPVGLETLRSDQLLALLSPKMRLPQPGKLSINVMDVPAQKLRTVHLVNYDFRYEVEHPGLYASDDGKAELRTYFGRSTTVLRKRVRVEKPSAVVEPVVQLYASATPATMADLVIAINGKPAARVPASALRASPVEAAFDPALLGVDNVIEVRVDGEVDGLQRWIQVGIDADTKAGNSEFSTDGGNTFSAADLSPDLREQTGEYLIRIVDKSPGGERRDANLVRNAGFEQVHTPHSETKLTVVPALSVPVQIEGAPQAALAISPEHAPVWLKGQAQGKLTTYIVPQVDIYTVLLLGPSQQALQAVYQAQMAAASWTVPPVTTPLRQLVRSWDKFGDGYTLDSTVVHSGKNSIQIENAAATDTRGATQTLDFTDAARQTYTVTAWSRAENVSGNASADYSLYVDATCVDGTVYNGHSTPFATGTHDWQQVKLQLAPPAPLKSLRVHLLFRRKTGRVWFDDLQMQASPAP